MTNDLAFRYKGSGQSSDTIHRLVRRSLSGNMHYIGCTSANPRFAVRNVHGVDIYPQTFALLRSQDALKLYEEFYAGA